MVMRINKIDFARMGIETMAFGVLLWRSNCWATENPHIHHIQLRYHPTADSVPVARLYNCSDPKLGIAAKSNTSKTLFLAGVCDFLNFLLFPAISPFYL